MSKIINRLFIIDDDLVYIMLTKKVINSTGQVSEINAFENGLDAISFLNENFENPDLLPDIILLDLMMPVMDGWQFLDEFILLSSKLHSKIPVFIVSSSINPEDHSKATSMKEVADFIIKPITKEKLINIIGSNGFDTIQSNV